MPNRLCYTDNHRFEYFLNISSIFYRNCVNLGNVIFQKRVEDFDAIKLHSMQ